MSDPLDPRPSRLLFVAKRLGGGGMARSLADAAAELVRQGHDVALHTVAGDAIDRFAPAMRAAGVEVELTDRLTLTGLRAAADRTGADAVRLFTGTFPPNTTVNRKLLRLGLPVVESIHAMAVRPVRPQHHLFYRLVLARRAGYRAALLSRPMLDESVRRLPYLRHKFVRLPFGMRLPEPGRTPADDGVLRLVTITRLTEIHKDTTTLLNALARLTRTDWRMTIVGAGRDAAMLEALAGRLGLRARVEFAGRLDDPFPVLRRADVFVLSTRAEAFGRVNVEAAAIGVPVVASDALGCRESVADGVNGLLVPTRDPDALAGALDRLLDDPALRTRLGAAGPAHARQFTPAAHAGALASLVRQLAEAAPAP